MAKYNNIILTGGVDDIWQDTNTKKLIVVDYKSKLVDIWLKQSLLASPYLSYKTQMDCSISS